MATRPNILIVGAGIVGASIAWHFTRAGARVTVVDAGEPGGVATRRSWAWINATWINPEPYFRLRVRSMQEWRRLEQEVPGLGVAWAGGLFWELPPERLETFQAQHSAWGYGIRRVGRAEAQLLEPHLAAPPAIALHVPAEGSVEPSAAAQTLLAAARDLGATVLPNMPVHSLALRAGKVVGVETQNGRLDADEVVVAGGVGTAALVAPVGVDLPMVDSPGVLVGTQPHPKCLNGLVMTPQMPLRQRADGRLLSVAEYDEADPDGARAAAALVEAMRGMLIGGASLALDFYSVGRRPLLRDGFPAVGRLDGVGGLYVAVTHSGVTLAPVLGRFVAEEVLTGRRDALLEPYGLARFA